MNLALGCIVGALVGETTGAQLKYHFGPIYPEDVKKAIHMSHSFIAGEKGEIMMALADSLCGKKTYSYTETAQAYRDWYESAPLECSMQYSQAFCNCGRTNISDTLHVQMLQNAKRFNIYTCSNSALIRAIPIGLWAYNKSIEEITYYARCDAMMTNPHAICVEANAVLALAIAILVKSHGNNDHAFKVVKEYVKKNVCTEVKDWFFYDRVAYYAKEYAVTPAKKNMLHVKHAFCLAINMLYTPLSFENGMKRVLSFGGDTTTNAAVCCAILGAIHGYDNIPSYMKTPILTRRSRFRPNTYSSENAINFIQIIMNTTVVLPFT